jgi:hypothetical protein
MDLDVQVLVGEKSGGAYGEDDLARASADDLAAQAIALEPAQGSLLLAPGWVQQLTPGGDPDHTRPACRSPARGRQPADLLLVEDVQQTLAGRHLDGRSTRQKAHARHETPL